MTRMLTITSGKGGVGKTNLCASLAMQLSAMGHRTCVFDADLGLANINIVLGLYPEHTIEDVVFGNLQLADIIIKDCHGIDIIPGSSGVEQIANIDHEKTNALLKSFGSLDPYDFILFDTSAGISRNVVSFCLASSEILMIITPEPTSLTDAYALVKVLSLNGLSSPIRVIVNQCRDTSVAKQTYSRFKEVVKKYLSIDIQALGFILSDPNISAAVKQQQPFIALYPSTIATKCIRVIANNLSANNESALDSFEIETFWKRFVGHFLGRLDLGRGVTEEKIAPQPVQPPPAAKETDVPPENKPGAELAPTAEEQVPATVPVPADEAHKATGFTQERSGSAVQDEPAAVSVNETRETAVEVPLPDQSQQNAGTDTKQCVPAGPEANLNDQNLLTVMDRLVTSISSISDEVKLLRTAVEGNGNLKAASSPAKPQFQPITLDFNAFLQRRTKEK